MTTDEIFYNALLSSEQVKQATGERIYATCVEIPPTEQDNTPLPYIVITYDGMQNDAQSKDDYEGGIDNEQVSIEVSHTDRHALGELIQKIRSVVHAYFAENENQVLDYQLQSSGVAWDWTKPCYYQTLTYNCSTLNNH